MGNVQLRTKVFGPDTGWNISCKGLENVLVKRKRNKYRAFLQRLIKEGSSKYGVFSENEGVFLDVKLNGPEMKRILGKNFAAETNGFALLLL